MITPSQEPAIKPPTYPARPISGGPLVAGTILVGTWYYEPKYNGWRTLVHVPSGTMWNRQNTSLTIQSEFAGVLVKLKETPFEWLDCEALERRHNLRRGTLIVLDAPIPFPSDNRPWTYERRRQHLEQHFPMLNTDVKPQEHEIYIPPSLPLANAWAVNWYEQLKEINRQWGAEFYEGVVAKRADSLYPLQTRSAKEEFRSWVKFRWHW